MVDDGSSDQSSAICDEYAQKHNNVFCFHQENKGVSAARNLGIREAKGRYIAFVDADDWVEKDYLQLLLENMTVHGLAACKFVENNGQPVHTENRQFLSLEETQYSIFAADGMQGFPWGKLFDRSILIDNEVFFAEDIGICEDVLFCIQYSKYITGNVCLTERTPYHYRKMNIGSTNKRYQKGVQLHDSQICEFVAIERCKKYLVNDSRVLSSWKARKVKGAVTDLRAMTASEGDYGKKYKERLDFVRENVLSYCMNSVGAYSAKLSVILCSISPKIELEAWKIIQ